MWHAAERDLVTVIGLDSIVDRSTDGTEVIGFITGKPRELAE
jgi:hypothetical protein